MCTFVTENQKEKTRKRFEQNVAVCYDLSALINTMIEPRGIKEDDMLISIGLYDGGVYMKICVSVFDLNSTQVGNKSEFKDFGVKIVMAIAIVPEYQEQCQCKATMVRSRHRQIDKKFYNCDRF